MGNYFATVAIFKELRDMHWGACGTARPKSGIPSQLVEISLFFLAENLFNEVGLSKDGCR